MYMVLCDKCNLQDFFDTVMKAEEAGWVIESDKVCVCHVCKLQNVKLWAKNDFKSKHQDYHKEEKWWYDFPKESSEYIDEDRPY